MIITCPSCAAKFKLPDTALGSKGRKVRCSRCEHVWRQTAQGASPYEPDDDDEEPASAPPPRRRPESGAAGDLPFERDPEGAPSSRDKASAFEQELSTLEDMLGKLSPSSTFEDKGQRNDFGRRDDDDIEDLDALLSAEDPDPIPRVFTGPRPTKKGGASSLLKTLVFLLVLIWGMALAGFFLRNTLVSLVPALAPVYSALRIEVESGRDEVIFQNVVSTLEAQGERRVLVVRGLLFNPSKGEHPLPGLQLVVMDAGGKVLQKVSAPAPQPVLAPGVQVPFQIAMENPSQLARDFRILFDTPP
ncbi:DUF3426 domain-containing protein [Pararhodospirillum photometricum]|nr:DUF3426 domain-containing protein [Pararhodospirillum photometricum]